MMNIDDRDKAGDNDSNPEVDDSGFSQVSAEDAPDIKKVPEKPNAQAMLQQLMKSNSTAGKEFLQEGHQVKIQSAIRGNLSNVFNLFDQEQEIGGKEKKSDKMVLEVAKSFEDFSIQLALMLGQSDESLQKLVKQVEKSNII